MIVIIIITIIIVCMTVCLCGHVILVLFIDEYVPYKLESFVGTKLGEFGLLASKKFFVKEGSKFVINICQIVTFE